LHRCGACPGAGTSGSTPPALTRRATGARPRPPAARPAQDLRPAWSPDGRQIAFQSNRDGPFHIYLMNADGSQPRALTHGPADDRHPQWTPDGQTLVFDRTLGQTQEIWALDLRDGKETPLTQLGGRARLPVPSPDGQLVAYYALQDGVLSLWTARLDGSQAQPAARDLASLERRDCTVACHQPVWSADSQRLLYAVNDLNRVWSAPRDGSTPPQLLSEGREQPWPWLVGLAYDPASGQRALLRGLHALPDAAEWSASQARVLFHTARSGNFDIYLIDLSAPGGLAALEEHLGPMQRE
jgi:Tol biopolymer transport system component